MTEDWQSQKFRQNVIAKINEMVQNTASDPTRNASVMENHIFKKSRTREEYLGLLAKLFVHFKELATRRPQQPPPPNADMGNGNIMQDPLNALQNLASQGNRNAQMMPMTGPNPNQIAPGAVVGVNAAASNLLQTLNQQRPGQQMQNMQGIRGQMNVPMGSNVGPGQGNVVGPSGNMVPQMAGNIGNMNMNVISNQGNQMVGANNQITMGPGQMNQIGSGVGANAVANQMQINPNMQSGPMNVNAMNVPQMPMNSMNQNQMNIGMNHPQLNQMITRANNNGPMNVGPNVVQQGMHSQLNAVQSMGNIQTNQGGQLHPNNVGSGSQVGIPPIAGQPGMSGVNQIINMPNIQQKPNMSINQSGNIFLGNRAVNQQSFLRQSPSPTVASPAGMGQPINQQQQQLQQQQLQQQQTQQQQPQPPQLPNPQMIPSPALVASSSPQMTNLIGNNQRALRQSPNAPLNTPGQVTTSSPFNPKEDQLYREKYQQLTKYIEPLKRMVSKISNDGANVEKITKMSKLLEILVNPTQRVSLETLLKCEKALEKMEIVNYTSQPFGKSSNPLFEVINVTLQSPTANHTLHRTFKPALDLIFGTDILPPPAKHPRITFEDTPSPFAHEIPHVLQGEIARLDQKFKVSLDSSAPNNTNTIKLICCLDDKRLPCVPPICVSIPEDYPSLSPSCSLTEQEYSATPFLLGVQNALTARISKLPKCHSLSHLLDTWEMSVRQACSPGTVAPCDFSAIFSV